MANNIVIPINKTVDISQGTLITTLGLQNTNDQLIQGQSYANVLNVSVKNNGVPVELSGECTGYFVRQKDGSTVQVAGTISGNMASVEFPSFVYAYTGWLTITLSVGGTDLVHIATTVRLGRTFVVVDPGNVLPNLDEIQQIMLDVENALNQLSGALEASQAATQAANTAAGTANTAAQGANDAASAANTAASALNGLTATANTLEPDEPATAVAELVSGAWKITFGIPRGVQGIQGVRGTVAWHGTAITGTSTTPTAYPTGIDSAIAGDLYLYSGTDVANIGNVYTCTQGGDASTALWAYMANWRGATGAGSVSSVNSVLPNANGDVELDGLIYPTTAQALEAMSQEQRAALYGQGYRAIKTENNGTVVLLGLAADGSLEWQGCNQPRENLLDNPDFAVAQAGYGGTHGTDTYAADRWPLFTAELSSGERGKIVVSSDSETGRIYHRFLPTPGPVTIGFFDADGNIEMVLADVPESLGTDPELLAATSKIQVYVNQKTIQVNYLIPQGGSQSFSRMFCYSGSYTPKTLPPWERPDYSVEIIKCQYFYRRDWVSYQAFVPGASFPGFSYPFKMRANPTVNVYDESGNIGYISTWGQQKAYKVSFAPAVADRLMYVSTETVPQTVVSCVYLIESIADL